MFDRVRTCDNHCPFCFIYQLPKGMRKSLYVKDDDFRLSFLHGNYITLTDLDEPELQRIETQRLSPLYVSVHATDPDLRHALLCGATGSGSHGFAGVTGNGASLTSDDSGNPVLGLDAISGAFGILTRRFGIFGLNITAALSRLVWGRLADAGVEIVGERPALSKFEIARQYVKSRHRRARTSRPISAPSTPRPPVRLSRSVGSADSSWSRSWTTASGERIPRAARVSAACLTAWPR